MRARGFGMGFGVHAMRLARKPRLRQHSGVHAMRLASKLRLRPQELPGLDLVSRAGSGFQDDFLGSGDAPVREGCDFLGARISSEPQLQVLGRPEAWEAQNFKPEVSLERGAKSSPALGPWGAGGLDACAGSGSLGRRFRGNTLTC